MASSPPTTTNIPPVIATTKSDRSKVGCAGVDAGASVDGVVPCAINMGLVRRSHAEALLLRRIRRCAWRVCIFDHLLRNTGLGVYEFTCPNASVGRSVKARRLTA